MLRGVPLAPVGEGCPKCGSLRVGVTDSRPHERGRMRRRKCDECDHRWSTLEVLIVHQGLDARETMMRALVQANELWSTLERLRDLMSGVPTVDDGDPDE